MSLIMIHNKFKKIYIFSLDSTIQKISLVYTFRDFLTRTLFLFNFLLTITRKLITIQADH